MIKMKICDIFIYFIISFLVITSFLTGKYLFLLDLFPDVNNRILDLFYGKDSLVYGGSLLLGLISMLVTAEIFQKLMIFIILFYGTYSMYDLINKMTLSRTSQFYAIFLYILNPFTYIRMLSGQWFLLLSYVALPLLLKVFIDLLDKREKKDIIKFIFILSTVSLSHMLIIALIIMSVIFIFWSFKYRYIRDIKIISIAIIIFILMNFYWIFPLITAKNTLIDNIGEEDYKVFAPKIDNLSDLFNIASMYGFWRDGYIYAKDFIPYWQLLSLFIISLAIYGFICYYKDDKIGYLVKALGVIWIIGFILATGINGPFGGINHWLYDNTILKGFRDSHKFVAMMVLSYSMLGALGISKFDEIRRKIK